MNVKYILLIILVLLLCSCSVIRECMKSKYEREYQICEDILNKRVNLDSIYSDPEISSEFLIKYFKNEKKIFEFLDESLYFEDYELIDIDKYAVSFPASPTYYKLDIVYTLRHGDLIEVVRFAFRFESNKFKLNAITQNPDEYYKYKRPKVDKPSFRL